MAVRGGARAGVGGGRAHLGVVWNLSCVVGVSEGCVHALGVVCEHLCARWHHTHTHNMRAVPTARCGRDDAHAARQTRVRAMPSRRPRARRSVRATRSVCQRFVCSLKPGRAFTHTHSRALGHAPTGRRAAAQHARNGHTNAHNHRAAPTHADPERQQKGGKHQWGAKSTHPGDTSVAHHRPTREHRAHLWPTSRSGEPPPRDRRVPARTRRPAHTRHWASTPQESLPGATLLCSTLSAAEGRRRPTLVARRAGVLCEARRGFLGARRGGAGGRGAARTSLRCGGRAGARRRSQPLRSVGPYARGFSYCYSLGAQSLPPAV